MTTKKDGSWSSHKRAFWKKMEKRGAMFCFYCSKPVRRDVWQGAPDRATIDHAVPKSKGGRDSFRNWIVACFPCNNQKADK